MISYLSHFDQYHNITLDDAKAYHLLFYFTQIAPNAINYAEANSLHLHFGIITIPNFYVWNLPPSAAPVPLPDNFPLLFSQNIHRPFHCLYFSLNTLHPRRLKFNYRIFQAISRIIASRKSVVKRSGFQQLFTHVLILFLLFRISHQYSFNDRPAVFLYFCVVHCCHPPPHHLQIIALPSAHMAVEMVAML